MMPPLRLPGFSPRSFLSVLPCRSSEAKTKTLLSLAGLGLITLALTLSLSACGGGGGGGAGGWSAPPPGVETTVVRQQPWTVSYQATGTLEANNKSELNAEFAGNITAIFVQEGQTVRRGQPLLRVKSDKQQAQMQESAAGVAVSLGNIEQQKADIRQAQARVNSAVSRRKLAESELKRFEKLQSDEFISQLELDQKRSAYDTAMAAYDEAMQGLSSSKARYAQANSSLTQARSGYRYSRAIADESFIRAPFNGIVGQKYVNMGDYADPGQRLITVVDPSSFKIRFTVPERYLGQIHPGQPIKTRFEGLKNASVSGVVQFIDPVVDAQAHTVMLKAKIPASTAGGQRLRHGLLGDVSLSLGVISDAVVVPEEAIVPQGEKTFVYVVKHETPPPPPATEGKPAEAPAKPSGPADIAHLREVIVGDRMEGFVRIDSGVQPGENVIVNGLQKVSDGMAVKPMVSKPASEKPEAVSASDKSVSDKQ
jgi:multidrug efflux pump subunit AcrA (membrane-fusion protein)